MTFTYLACPYAHKDPEVRRTRVELASRFVLDQTARNPNRIIYSPLTHNYTLDQLNGEGKLEFFWRQHGINMLLAARELFVLRLSSWEESKGVQEELRLAQARWIPRTDFYYEDLGFHQLGGSV